VNEERVRQILDIEDQAQAIYQEATQQAEELPARAEREAKEVVEQARADAQREAQQLIEKARAEDACDRILDRANVEAERMEHLGESHFDRAVGYVLDRLAGKE
jgi:vacuolar-type H+-ATPase subunit H